MKQNLFGFSLFLNTCNFPIFRNLYKENRFSCTYLWRISLSRFLSLFYGRGTSRSRRSQRVSRLTSVQRLKIHFQISLTEKWHFGAKGLWVNHLTFSSLTIPSGHDTRVTWIPFFVQQTAGYRVRGTDLHSCIILTVSLSASWFKLRRVGESASPSLSL